MKGLWLKRKFEIKSGNLLGCQNAVLMPTSMETFPRVKTLALCISSRFQREKDGTNSTESLRCEQSGFW